MIKQINTAIIFCAFAAPALAGVAKFNGTAFEVVTGDVKSACGANYAFRDQHKDQVPAYLQGEVIKASFKGTKFSASLADAKAVAKAGNKCLWFADSEKGGL